MLVEEDLKQRCHQAKLWSLDTKFFSLFELSILDKYLNSRLISLLFDEQNDLFLGKPGILNFLEQDRWVIVLLLIQEGLELLSLWIDEIWKQDAFLIVLLILDLKHVVDI